MKYKSFQFFSIKSRRFATSFEGLNSSPAQSTGELWSYNVVWK